MSRPALILICFLVILAVPCFGQMPDDTRYGDGPMAEYYVAWAKTAIDEDRWAEAEAALERAADFSDVSSDLSYLLALARSHQRRPLGMVLEAVQRSLAADRWTRYTPEAARLVEARTLITLRHFSEALTVLSLVPESAEAALLRLTALKGLPNGSQFRSAMAQALERYPRDPRPVRLFFSYAAGRLPQGNELDMVQTALTRLPLLLEADPGLAYLAVPFIRDNDEARRLLAAYRAANTGSPAAIPAALNLGLIGEDQAIDELFSPSPGGSRYFPGEFAIDKALLLKVWSLLRNNEGRDRFMRNLLRFSGVITEDADDDACPEIEAQYRDGLVTAYYYDADQDGLPEIRISFSGGIPYGAELVSSAESSPDMPAAFPLGEEDRTRAMVSWEQYPVVLQVELEGVRYMPRPREFLLTPVIFETPFGGEGVSFLYPRRDPRASRLTRRSLVSFAQTIERPSVEFDGAIERIELERGIPQRAAEFLKDRVVSVTEFLLGRPLTQRIDLDLDGRMETIRHFQDENALPDDPLGYAKILEWAESDWDGDGIFEVEERYLPDGGIIRSWDMDGDGIREYTEAGSGK